MTRVGEAFYELGARNSRLKSDLRAATTDIRSAGRVAETAFGTGATGGINRFSGAVRSAVGRVGGLGGAIRGMTNTVTMGMGPFGLLTNAVSNLGRGMIGGAGANERYRVQLETLLGSTEAAKDRLAELTEFAKTTPFELPQIIEASRTLQVFTQGALATGPALRQIGDVAAGTGQPIQEVSMWFGRLYDAMQSGRPFGEATMRLQEMGALSGASRAKIEELAASVAAGKVTMNDAWESVGGEFSQFAGLMEKQSTTLEGQWSNLQDAIGQGLSGIGEFLLPLAKVAIPLVIGGLTDLANFVKTQLIPGIQDWAEENRPLLDALSDLGGAVLGGVASGLETVIGWIGGAVTEAGKFVTALRENGAIDAAADFAGELLGLAGDITNTVLDALNKLWTWLNEDGKLSKALKNVFTLLGDLVEKLREFWEYIQSPEGQQARELIISFLTSVATIQAANAIGSLYQNFRDLFGLFGAGAGGVGVARFFGLPGLLLGIVAGVLAWAYQVGLLGAMWDLMAKKVDEFVYAIRSWQADIQAWLWSVRNGPLKALFDTLQTVQTAIQQAIDLMRTLLGLQSTARNAAGVWSDPLPKGSGEGFGGFDLPRPPPDFGPGAGAMALSSGRLDLYVHDVDGGLARSGITERGLAERILDGSGLRRGLRHAAMLRPARSF